MINYAEYILKDIGNPPSLEQAKKIAKQFSIQIRYEGKDGWTTSKSVPTVAKVKKHKKRHKHEHRHNMGGKRGKFYLLVEKDYGSFIFYADAKRFFNWDEEYTFFLIGMLTLVVAGAYVGIRWVLKPITWLSEGVEQIAGGNLAHRIPVRKRRDELGELAESFNSMAQRVGEMLHSKEQLLLDVSHELRSPITRMKVALELAPNGEKTESIKDDLLEMEKMITELLETEKLNSGHGRLIFAQTDISMLVKEVINEYSHHAPEIKFTDASRRILVNIDADRVRLVIKNLLDNAIKYSEPENGTVEISINTDSESCVIEVRDHGEGVPEEELPYIFEPFYRADKSRSRKTGGYGLGLSLCKKIIEAHGGNITLDSIEGEGTKVSIRFALS